MKLYKKILSVFMILCIIISLNGCIIIPRYARYDFIDVEKVSTIEIYEINKNERIDSSDVNADTLAYSLDKSEFSDFLNKLAKIQFKKLIILVPAPIDAACSYGNYVVQIKYNNGRYILITNRSFGEAFDENGNTLSQNLYGCDTKEWEWLIFNYLPKEINNNSDTSSINEKLVPKDLSSEIYLK
ncbi:MAG: hypothetical protein IJE65_01595 [Clostridia bacterium]|nr:hypothetical protein [Clostridia bacterium]